MLQVFLCGLCTGLGVCKGSIAWAGLRYLHQWPWQQAAKYQPTVAFWTSSDWGEMEAMQKSLIAAMCCVSGFHVWKTFDRNLCMLWKLGVEQQQNLKVNLRCKRRYLPGLFQQPDRLSTGLCLFRASQHQSVGTYLYAIPSEESIIKIDSLLVDLTWHFSKQKKCSELMWIGIWMYLAMYSNLIQSVLRSLVFSGRAPRHGLRDHGALRLWWRDSRQGRERSVKLAELESFPLVFGKKEGTRGVCIRTCRKGVFE